MRPCYVLSRNFCGGGGSATVAPVNAFDRKFGPERLDGLPSGPGVYLFTDDRRRVLYVGKAKNLRRRLAAYRNASRRKAHRKMRALVRHATHLEVRRQESERAALKLENELIQELEPPFNVEGRYSFLYPAIGFARTRERTLLCFTTHLDAWAPFELRWCGVFRSRLRARAAFDALVDVACRLGHRERSATLHAPRLRGSRLVGVRRLAPDVATAVESYLVLAAPEALPRLCRALLERPQARHEAAEVEAHLRTLEAFRRSDLEPLLDALRRGGREGSFVVQRERDRLFIDASGQVGAAR